MNRIKLNIKSQISLIILAAGLVLIVGGGVYFWQRSLLSKEFQKQTQSAQVENGKLQQEINVLQNQIAQLQAQKETPASEEEPTEQKEKKPATATEKAMGYVNIYESAGKRYLDIDYVQWLTDKEAIKAAIEDKECFQGEDVPKLLKELEGYDISNGFGKFGSCAPNGFYIRNKNPQVRTFEISKNAEITMQTLSHTTDGNFNFGEKVSYKTFKSLFTSKDSHFRNLPFHIEVVNGLIMKITEQYVP